MCPGACVMQKAGAAFDRLNGVMDKMDKGEGSLGRFMQDTRLYDNLNRLIQVVYDNGATIVLRAQAGSGYTVQLVRETGNGPRYLPDQALTRLPRVLGKMGILT